LIALVTELTAKRASFVSIRHSPGHSNSEFFNSIFTLWHAHQQPAKCSSFAAKRRRDSGGFWNGCWAKKGRPGVGRPGQGKVRLLLG